ncbi:hypothetical protein [Namhaeicola litoreus]|uniref:Right handed beta helix region n=1 Tax=Namhaeicola litoreus TaxID=1052145 RepID=A0ABW3Y2Q8_9FLAO
MKYAFVSIVISILFSACLSSDFDTTINKGSLTFSKDTLYLDTVFTNTSSSTRTLKVYNKSNQNLSIPSVYLERGNSSFYRLNVDGVSGKRVENIDILAKDSLFIFVEVTIDFNQVSDPLYIDQIVFSSENEPQKVELVTLVQDAHFLFPQKNSEGIKETLEIGIDEEGNSIVVDGFYLSGSQQWTNDKPYVIYGFAGVSSGNSLQISKGTQIYFHQNSGLIIEKGGSLEMTGEIGEEVVLQGDRLEQLYKDNPGQWSTIWLRAGSVDNRFENVIIKNNDIGIVTDSLISQIDAGLTLKNVQIYNTSSFGILGRNAHIKAENVVVANNGNASVACTFGGKYEFIHSTLANFWNKSIRQFPTLYINNFVLSSNGEMTALANNLVQANFINCIIDGNQNAEMVLERMDGADFNYFFQNNLIQFSDNSGSEPLYDFNNPIYYLNNIFTGNSDFLGISQNNFLIGEDSEAIDLADQLKAQEVPFDLLGNDRRVSPDAGAYQYAEDTQ